MNNSIKIAPSILSADFSKLAEQIALVENAGAEFLHLDIMDGHFVPNLTFGPPVVKSIRSQTKMSLDCHLMVNNPEFLVPLFAKAGADHITVHAESSRHLDRLIHQIQDLGCTAGVSLNPASPLELIRHVEKFADSILIMSVNPGFGGQKLIPYCLEKTAVLRQRYPEKDIQIDGGVCVENIAEVRKAGVNNFVAGSAVFGARDVAGAVRDLRKNAENA